MPNFNFVRTPPVIYLPAKGGGQLKLDTHTTNLPPLELQPSLQFKFLLQLTQQLQQQVAINSQLQRLLHTMTTQLQRNCICNSSIATHGVTQLQHDHT